MTTKQNYHNKRILKDPLSEFTSSHPDGNSHQETLLKEVSEQYLKQKRELRIIRDQMRHVSKNIGDAKRAGKPCDDLKELMREKSTHARVFTERLKAIEKRILNFFTPNGVDKKNHGPITPKLAGRIYPSTLEKDNDITISVLESEVEEWNNYVTGNPAASIYHRAEWKTLIRKTFGHESFYFFARDKSGNIRGVLPLIRQKSRLFGDFLTSMPYFNYGGAVADHALIEQQLIHTANNHAGKLGVSYVEYRDDIPRKGLPVKANKLNMILPLPEDSDELWQGFTPKLRAQIRRPQRENLQVSIGGKEYIDDFYTVFTRNMRDLGTPVYGKEFFTNIMHHFPQESCIKVIHYANEPVAAGFLIGYRDTLEIPWASTIRDFNHLSVNMLLYWEILRYAISKGYKYFDFGRSTRDSGAFRFKQQWGAMPKTLYWHYWLNGTNELPSLNPTNPKYLMMINTWKRLPIVVTKLLGPMIVKNLP
jgi:FemAB-related protein (PEP-CTERM system-associated)